jgi:hypothetical protein
MSNPLVRRGAQIGQPDAEGDDEYLSACFIDNGVYEAATDIDSPGSIVLGRTGSGKSAILRMITEREDNVIQLSPETLSMSLVANSQVLNFFEAAGVHLDAFYILLWKHIFVVELLKKKYHISNEDGQKWFFSSISNVLTRDRAKERALDYIRLWGEKFWVETDYRIREFTTKIEQKLEGDVGIDLGKMRAGAKGAAALTEEQKADVIHRGQRAVNEVQVRELHEVIRLLADDIFTQRLERYYICIDKLDDDWVGDDIRFKLLKALIETIRAFRAIRPVKVIVALRTDLYFSMIRRTNSPGFQEEKLAGYYIPLKWNRQQICDLLDRRVNYLFQRQYTRDDVRLGDLLPHHQVDKGTSADYIIERTFFRPREAISFVNKCLEKAEGVSRFTLQLIRDAETAYSAERLNSIYDEWRREYPYLRDLMGLIRSGRAEAKVGDFSVESVEAFCVEFYACQNIKADPGLAALAENAAMDAGAAGLPFLRRAVAVLYQTGIVGLKLLPTSPRMWSFEDLPVVDPAEIGGDSTMYIHKAFHRSLAISYAHT